MGQLTEVVGSGAYDVAGHTNENKFIGDGDRSIPGRVSESAGIY